jgi:hypothetical protein
MYCWIYSRIKRIKPLTSSCGRVQFSVLKAYTVKYLMFIFSASLASFLSVCAPALCPDVLERRRDFAHRPLPSIIMAK